MLCSSSEMTSDATAFKTPAQPEGDPVAQQAANNPRQPGIPET